MHINAKSASKYKALEEERLQEQNERIQRLKFQQRLDAQMQQKVRYGT